MSEFELAVKPLYQKLIKTRQHFVDLDLDTASVEDVQQYIYDIETGEHQVLLAWATSTSDINPGMVDDVCNGRMKWYPALDDYLKRMLSL